MFAEALKENRTLKYLDLSYNEFGEVGGLFLGAGVVNKTVFYVLGIWLLCCRIIRGSTMEALCNVNEWDQCYCPLQRGIRCVKFPPYDLVKYWTLILSVFCGYPLMDFPLYCNLIPHQF